MSDNQLRLFMERIDRLEEEKKGIGDDIRDVYAEAKSQGYDAKIMRALRNLMKMSSDDRANYEAVLDTYKVAVGLDGTPLGDYRETKDPPSALHVAVQEAAVEAIRIVDARRVVRESGMASVSHLQRSMRVGYNAAARLMDALEAEGSVSAPDAQGKRTVVLETVQ
jgi:uncharacterized protein (UPF0335 family)